MEHGHSKMMDWLSQQPVESMVGKTLVEIGTVREIIENQNSTEKLARYCNKYGMKFITVDMNPETTASAVNMLEKINPSFKAYCNKGEDFFTEAKTYNLLDSIDYVYLDAFDFNHHHHSKKRRDDYIKYLGCDINDKECHQSHLKMCVNLLENWDPLMICWDDCWYTNNIVHGKGKLGIPYLLMEGWKLDLNWVMTPPISK